MHFDSLLKLIVAGFVLEFGQIEVRSQFSIDASKKVQIKRPSDAERVVVSCQHLVDRLDQVCAHEEHITPLQVLVYCLQKISNGTWSEIPNRASKEQYQQCRSGSA